MKNIPNESIDMVMTSPPYDNLRTYNGEVEWNFDKFSKIALQLCRVLKKGGVIVWIVNDATIKGSETGSSFKQALFFMQQGLNLHDTMIWEKPTIPYDPKCNRYWQTFEYMFIFSKGKPICNYLTEPCKNAGKKKTNDYGQKRPNGELRTDRYDDKRVIKDTKVRSNIWYYSNNKTVKGHPAQYPEQLAIDHILSWSNENSLILDPFMGSGTTGVATLKNNRNFIGIELVEKYYNIAKNRIQDIVKTMQNNDKNGY